MTSAASAGISIRPKNITANAPARIARTKTVAPSAPPRPDSGASSRPIFRLSKDFSSASRGDAAAEFSRTRSSGGNSTVAAGTDGS